MTPEPDQPGQHVEQPTPEQTRDALDSERLRGRVIRCAPADGPQTDYLNVGRKIHPRTWVAWSETDDEAHMADTDDVTEAVRDAWPAVYPIPEEESRWGED